jgi:hypothetical protein
VIDKLTNADPLSGILDRLRTVPWSAGVATFQQHWAVATPSGQVSFYVAAQGSFQLKLDGAEQTVPINAGTYTVLPHGVSHVLYSQPGSSVRSWSDARRDTRREAGGAPSDIGSATTIIYGHFPADALGSNCLDVLFPPLAQLDSADTPLLARCAPMVDLLLTESRNAEVGWQAIHPIGACPDLEGAAAAGAGGSRQLDPGSTRFSDWTGIGHAP